MRIWNQWSRRRTSKIRSSECHSQRDDDPRSGGEDTELQQLRKCIDTGAWVDCPDRIYAAISGELCVIGQLVLRVSRIVIPHKLRPQALALAHEEHLGMVWTKQALTCMVWWPSIGCGEILQSMPWVSTSCTTGPTRTYLINDPTRWTVSSMWKFLGPPYLCKISGPDIKGTSKAKHRNIAHRFWVRAANQSAAERPLAVVAERAWRKRLLATGGGTNMDLVTFTEGSLT